MKLTNKGTAMQGLQNGPNKIQYNLNKEQTE